MKAKETGSQKKKKNHCRRGGGGAGGDRKIGPQRKHRTSEGTNIAPRWYGPVQGPGQKYTFSDRDGHGTWQQNIPRLNQTFKNTPYSYNIIISYFQGRFPIAKSHICNSWANERNFSEKQTQKYTVVSYYCTWLAERFNVCSA